MQQLPVSSSILSATGLCPYLEEHYKFDKKITCGLIKAGINHTYLVQSGVEKFIFRIYSLNWKSKREIVAELDLILLLQQSMIGVSYPLAAIDNEYICEVEAPEGLRFAVLFSYAPGEKIIEYPATVHFAIGETMARMHQLTENLRSDRVEYNARTLLLNSLPKLEPFISPDTDEMKFMSTAQQFLLHEFEKFHKEKASFGTIHLDIWFDNLNIAEGNKITIFDFDFCGTAGSVPTLHIIFYNYLASNRIRSSTT